MHRGASFAAGCLLAALVSAGSAGCGAPDGLSIEFSDRALLAQAAQVVIYFYANDQTCANVRDMQPRPASVLGPFQVILNDNARDLGITFTLNEVPVGEYVIFVDALDGAGTNVGTGCAPGQQVRDREISKIQVFISDG